MIKFIIGIFVGFCIFKYDVISSVSSWDTEYGVKEMIIEKLQDEEVDIENLNNGEVNE